MCAARVELQTICQVVRVDIDVRVSPCEGDELKGLQVRRQQVQLENGQYNIGGLKLY